MRVLSVNYSPQELSVYRNVVGVLPAIFYMWYSKELSIKFSDYKIEKWKLGVLRGFIIAIAQLCFYTALSKLEFATVSALGQVSAFFTVLLAIFIYKEKVGFWRWTALIVGFLGAVMIINLDLIFFLGIQFYQFARLLLCLFNSYFAQFQKFCVKCNSISIFCDFGSSRGDDTRFWINYFYSYKISN